MITKYKILFLLLVVTFGFAQNKVTITVENNLDFAQNEKLIEIEWSKIKALFNQIDTTNFIVIDAKTKKQLPYQLEFKGNSKIQNLLVQVSCKAKSQLKLTIKSGKKIILKSKLLEDMSLKEKTICMGK
ncbi:MAG: DUF4861 domain-containing protein [Flavobacterium sp.]|nr:DUF4861 domain-containing protein [Flavobacterium sp.]